MLLLDYRQGINIARYIEIEASFLIEFRPCKYDNQVRQGTESPAILYREGLTDDFQLHRRTSNDPRHGARVHQEGSGAPRQVDGRERLRLRAAQEAHPGRAYGHPPGREVRRRWRRRCHQHHSHPRAGQGQRVCCALSGCQLARGRPHTLPRHRGSEGQVSHPGRPGQDLRLRPDREQRRQRRRRHQEHGSPR